jgi:hypothetical protein
MRLILIATILSLFGLQAAAQNPKDFNVTDGKIERATGGRLQIRTKEVRATLKKQTVQKITVNFTYVGPTQDVSHLGDGSVRHQFGLKLQAQDICNLVYVMWHFDSPKDNRLEVSVKSNPGRKTHEDCLDNGYIFALTPTTFVAAPIVKVDEAHTLSAELSGRHLLVHADNLLVWEGDLPEVVSSFNGPIGFRSDNAHVVFDYAVGK